MTPAKVKEQDGIGTRSNNACKCKSPKYPYISGLKEDTVIDGCKARSSCVLEDAVR